MPTKTKKKSPQKKTAKKTTTTIEVKLPGGIAVETPLINKAVNELNIIYTKKGLETAEAIGGYLIKTFFKGDASNFHEYGKKHATFKALAENEGLQFSASYLWFAVPVWEQIKALPADVAKALPLSHHRILVAVRDEKKKLTLANKAIKKGLSKRDFWEEVKKNRGTQETSSGRPPLPAFAKGLSKLVQAIEIATAEEVTDRSFLHFDLSKTKELLDQVDGELGKLTTLRDSLHSRVGELEDSNN